MENSTTSAAIRLGPVTSSPPDPRKAQQPGGASPAGQHPGVRSAADGSSTAARAALVINTEFAAAFAGSSVSPDAVARLERFAAQAFARSLLPQLRVSMCLRMQVAGRVSVRASLSKKSARLGGVAVCGLGWVCPVCAAKIAERRRAELDEALQAWRRAGGVVLMATFTFSHVRTDKLSDILQRIVDAYRDMTGNRPYKRLRKLYGLKHTVRALELTWGNAYGWHPHFHVLLFLTGEVDRAALEQELYECWSAALAAYGLHVERQFVHLRHTDNAADQYVAEWGRAWSAADELTKANVKRGRLNHYTPFDLLRLGATGVRWAAYRFEEYVEATRGKSQLQWSRGLRAALGLSDPVSELEAAAAVEADEVVLALLEPHEFATIRRYHQIGQLLEVARSLDADRVRVFVDYWCRRYLAEQSFIDSG